MSEETFKRVEYKHAGPFQISEYPLSSLTSSLKPTEVIVKVKAASLNPIDILLYNTHWYFFFKRNTKGLGRDFSGVISHVGSEVESYRIGDTINGIFEPFFSEQGTLSEYIKLDTLTHPNLGKLPAQLTPQQGASFPVVFGTAYTTFTHHKKPTKDSRVLLIGGGTSVGWYALQLLKNYYNTDFVVSINSGKSSERVQSLGVDKIIDYTKGDITKEVLSIIEASGGEKFDLILDTVGNSDFFPIIDQVLKPKSEDSGYVTVVGDDVADYHSTIFSFATLKFLYKNLFPQSFNYKLSGVENGIWYDFAVELFEQGKLKTLIDSVHTLDNFQDAIDTLIDHKAQGKVILQINE